MRRPTLIYGIVIAFLLSVLSLVLMICGSIFLYPQAALKISIGLCAACYLILLMRRKKTKSGVTAMTLACVGVIGGGLLLPISAVHFMLVVTAVIWFVRSIISYRSIVSSLLDLVLCGLAVSAAMVAFLVSGTVSLAVWTYFLGHALFVFIPERFASEGNAVGVNPAAKKAKELSGFESAREEAARAVEQLIRESVAG